MNGPYTNNPHVLVRYDLVKDVDRSLALVLSQYQKSKDLSYSIAIYCTERFKFRQSVDPLPICRVLNGSWELRVSSKQDQRSTLGIGSAGGSPGKGSWGSNPQWSLNVGNDTIVQLKCMAMKTLAINVILVQSQTGRRVHHLYESPTIDSGDYRYGFVVTARTLLTTGVYTLIASTFEAGQVGSFILHVMTDRKIDITEVK